MQGLITAAILLLLIRSTVLQDTAGTKPAEGAANKAQAYEKALQVVADNVNKATEKSEELIKKHMSAVDKDPGALITKEAMQRMVQGSSFLPQKAGTRSIVMEAQQGFNGISNYQPSSWKLTETMSGPVEKKPEPSSEKQPVYTYPVGLGPVLMNQCTAASYDKTSPCYNSKLFDLQNTICTKMMDAANYMGVGFDGRGYYRADSRRGSLIQRACAGRATFMGQDVPDTMNVYGIFETTAETKSFQSVDEYMSYIRNKAGLSEQKNLFTSEASKYSKASSFGINLGGIGSMIGAGIGAYVGGPVGAAMGASIGGAIGGSIGGGSGKGSGSESATDKGQSSSQFQQTDQSSQKQGSSQNFFAIMYVNVVLYEISLDDVKPADINLAALRDYMSLPVSYFSVGADVKYQNFLLRWGTHYIRSGKFGGQLKITKTAKADKIHSATEFASIAETEFQSMFATLQSKYSQESSSWGFLGIGGESKSASQTSSAKSESEYKSTFAAKNQQSQAFRQSEFTQTTVEAQGGTPTIAEALVDFYTPAFKQLFHEWIESIKDYVKPFEFQLRPINLLFNLNTDTLFPAGNTDFGCMGGGSSNKADILVDPKTKKRYYMDTQTAIYNNITVVKRVRVYCPYSNIDEFKQEMERRMVSLERAVGIYMSEGPFPTSSVELEGGQPGCEEATVARFQLFGPVTEPLKYSELLRQPFIIAFDLPESVPDVVTTQARYIMTYRFDRWFAVEPNQDLVRLYDGCQVANLKPTDRKVCFRNIILTYEESDGFFIISKEDFALSKQRNNMLPYWLSGSTVARSRKIFGPTSGDNSTTVYNKKPQRAAIPCNVKWLNSHRVDPSKPENCIHFTAATEGDLYVIFASIPRDHTTWYYLEITPEGVNFHHAMSLHKSDLRKGMGLLGDKNLYQSFFVCVIQKSSTVTMQYGKADPDSEVGTVYAAYTYPPDSLFSVLTFYSFGSGTKPVSLMDVRLTKQMPTVACLGNDYVKKDSLCVLDCHAECNGCSQARDSKACQQCKNMRLETRVGDTKTTECITNCPVGMYSSDTQAGLCVQCIGGTFKAKVGNEKCTPCAVGTSSADGASICAGCPAGTYSSSVGQKCEKCPAGKFSASGATSCTDCPVGTFSEEPGQSECNPCLLGHFGNSIGRSQCTPCDAGFYANRRGMTACTKCPVGSSNARGSSSCENNCGLGEFSPQLGVACTKCSPGSITESRGATSCVLCAVGTYQPNSGESKCLSAPKGAYVATKGATAVVLCPPGTYNDLLGQTGTEGCKPCPAGSYASATGSIGCTQCAGGYYAPARSTACTLCSEFQYSTPGSAECKACPNNALVKSDRMNCYRRIFFTTATVSGIYNHENNAQKAMDDNRNTMFISQEKGWKSWKGVFQSPVMIRRVVLWSRTDCCQNQFLQIEVWAYLPDGRSTYCGHVGTWGTYNIISCDTVATAIEVRRPSDPWMTVAEVEAYGD